MIKRIEAFDKAASSNNSLKELGINPTLFWAYQHSIDAEHDLINFDEVIWDYDIKLIIEAFKENEITHFTNSGTFSGLITTIWELEKLGCKIDVLIEVNSRNRDYMSGERKKVPAMLIRI